MIARLRLISIGLNRGGGLASAARRVACCATFVGDYETAREASFSASERRLCAAAFAYSCAYTARCGHALGKDVRGEAGTFAHLVWTERQNLLLM